MTSGNEPKSEIQQFFNGANVFVTGATGFVGQVLVEKILRSCPVNKVYILVRPKRNTDPKNRLLKLFSTPLFNRLREERPDFIDKVSLITGDCAERNLGLSEKHENFMVDNIDVVLHCAASINFTGQLKDMSFINVRATRDLMLIARRMQKLKSFVYVSTAFSNANQSLIEEKIYKNHMPGDTLINIVENLPDSLINSISAKCLGTWPNTYSFSKCVAENIVEEYGKNMPICIVRPCIVTFTQDEPITGWVTNLKSVPGLCIGIGLGAIHVMYVNPDLPAEFAPADKVANMIITSAWHASKTFSEISIPIFNYVPSNFAPSLTMGKVAKSIVSAVKESNTKSIHKVWEPSVFVTSSSVWYTILHCLFHHTPASLADFYLRISGKKPRFVKLYNTLDVMQKEMKYFGVKPFNFVSDNVKALLSSQSTKDKTLFNMDLSDMNFDIYTLNNIDGTIRYTFNESGNSIDSEKRDRQLMILHYTVKVFFYGVLIYIIYSLLKILFKIY